MRSILLLAVAAGLLIGPVALAQKNDGGSNLLAGACAPQATTLCIPLDGSFTVVRMDASTGGNGQADPADPCQRNDDDSSLAIPLQFTFDFYGTTFTDVFVNNNGNVSFGQPFPEFTATGFPVAGFPMIAPFWADVDTRDPVDNQSGVVYFKSEAHRFTVIWSHVGYYNVHFDKLNTFELIMSDGTDPIVGLGNNVCFCYDDMQWTTGDASGGSGGFGGTAATVGANQGNGVDFFQVGRFDHPGTDYDGPGGNNDGVDFLDHSRSCFFTGTSTNNIPPAFINLPPNQKVDAIVGQTATFVIQAIAPELNQTTTMTVVSGGLANFSATLTPGNPATATCAFTPDASQLGNAYPVTFTATDNFMPPASTTVTIQLNVTECPTTIGFDMLDGVEIPLGELISDEFENRGVLVSGVSLDTGHVGVYTNRSGGPGSETDDLIPTSPPNFITTAPHDPFDPRVSDFGRIRFDFVDPETHEARPVDLVSLKFLDVESSGSPGGRGTSKLRAYRADGSFVEALAPRGPNAGMARVQIGSAGGPDAFLAAEAFVGDSGDSAAVDDLCFHLFPPPVTLTCDGSPSQVPRGGVIDFYVGVRNNVAHRVPLTLIMQAGRADQTTLHVTLFTRTHPLPVHYDNTLLPNRYHFPISIPANPNPRVIGRQLQILTRAINTTEGWEYGRDRFLFVIQ